jgi:hypothetical protein
VIAVQVGVGGGGCDWGVGWVAVGGCVSAWQHLGLPWSVAGGFVGVCVPNACCVSFCHVYGVVLLGGVCAVFLLYFVLCGCRMQNSLEEVPCLGGIPWRQEGVADVVVPS